MQCANARNITCICTGLLLIAHQHACTETQPEQHTPPSKIPEHQFNLTGYKGEQEPHHQPAPIRATRIRRSAGRAVSATPVSLHLPSLAAQRTAGPNVRHIRSRTNASSRAQRQEENKQGGQRRQVRGAAHSPSLVFRNYGMCWNDEFRADVMSNHPLTCHYSFFAIDHRP